MSECLRQKDLRFESDFWIQKNDSQKKTIKGSEIIDFVQYGTSKELIEEKEGYPILRLNEFNSRFIGVPSKYCKLISKDDFKSLKLQKNDVLICRTNGNPNLVGKSALVAEDVEYAYASYLFKIRPKSDLINSATLVAFLSCKYGRKEIDKYSMTSNQTNFSPAKFREIDIPLFSNQINKKIEKLYYSAFDKLKQSETLYHQAEDLLLETLCLKNFKPSKKATNIKSFKESFLATGRLDAEYYQVKYEEIIAKIKKQPHDVLGNLANIKKSIEPGSDVYTDKGLPFIRVSDYNKFGISTPEKCLSSSFCSENAALLQSLYPAKETILFSKDGSVGTAYMVSEDMQAVTSGAILHLTVKDKTKILPEYLALALNSEAVKQQAERDAGGSIILHWRINEIENVVVPIVEYKIQQKISTLIKESFNLRRESEELLEEAKGMVEREIG
ncbi:dna methylase-type I restriction-modification system [Fibrobacteria bacterium R8-3-H12]